MRNFGGRLAGAGLLFLAVACGAPRDRGECGASSDCGEQAYCARTPDGNVCWPDAQPPVVQSVTVTCVAPCLRDATLQVSASVADDQAIAAVSASIPALSQTRVVSMAPSGGKYVASLALAEWPFPAFEQGVTVQVTARDEAGNEASVAAAGGQVPTVTRLRSDWTYDAGVPITSPAVLADGTAIFGRSATSDQVVAVRAGQKLWSATVGSSFVTAAPSVGEDVWVGTQAGTLQAVSVAGTAGASCATGEAINFPLAIAGSRAIGGSQAATVAVAGPGSFCNQTSVAAAVGQGPVVTGDGSVYTTAGAILYSFALPVSGVLKDNWTGVDSAPTKPTLGGTPSAPLAVDGSGRILTLASNGKLDRTTAAAVTENLATVSAGSTGPVVLADGSIVVGDASGVLKRIADTGWSESAVLNGVPAIPLVLAGSTPTLLVPTSTGRLYAIDASNGSIAWSVKLSATGQALQPANIHTAAGAPTSTAFVAGADGKLYAVVVDGRLDAAAPWPKAFHDPRNTSNAGVAP